MTVPLAMEIKSVRNRHPELADDALIELLCFRSYVRSGSLPSMTEMLEALRPESKFDENQPRVPAGSPDGGQWTDGLVDDAAAYLEDYARIEEVADINGFTKHGINQVINRGISPDAILDAVKNPLDIVDQPNGTTRFIGGSAVVVLNPAGLVVTVWGQ